MELITRNNLRPGDDIEIQFTGIRPGEKLYEELSCDNEQIRPSGQDKICVWQLPAAQPAEVAEAMR
jgi:FlaA1/EpsC-like NDP-sugar epimerase